LLDVDEHRIEPLDLRERIGLRRRDERADGEQRPPDAAGDRRGDGRELQVDLCGFERGAGLRDRGRRLARGGDRVGVILLADRLHLGERLVAVGEHLLRLLVGTRALQIRLRLVGGGAIKARVDLVERLALLDEAAFGEEAAADDAGDLGADVRAFERRRASAELRGHGNAGRLDHDIADGRRALARLAGLALALRGVAAAAGTSGEGQRGRQQDGAAGCRESGRREPERRESYGYQVWYPLANRCGQA
jgi:hypothetical protein